MVLLTQMDGAIIKRNSDERSAMDIVKKFELELHDDFFARSIRQNKENRRPRVGSFEAVQSVSQSVLGLRQPRLPETTSRYPDV